MPPKKVVDDDDDWDTDPNYVNDVSEKEQRFGSKVIQAADVVKEVKMDQVHAQLEKDIKESEARKSGFARGYGGDFGTEGRDQTTQAKFGGKIFDRKTGHVVGDAPAAANPHVVSDSLLKPSQG